MYARATTTATKGPSKKANLMKRLRRRGPELFHAAVREAAELAEYKRKRECVPYMCRLPPLPPKPEKTPTPEEKNVPLEPTPPRPAKRVASPKKVVSEAPPPEPLPPPVSETVPRASVESQEIEMATSPPRVNTRAPVEVEMPLVIPASPIEADAMDESPFKPKRSRSPPPMGPSPPMPSLPSAPCPPQLLPQAPAQPPPPAAMLHEPMQPAPFPAPPQPQAPMFQAAAQPPAQPGVPGRRRILKPRKKGIRPDDMDTSGEVMGQPAMVMEPTYETPSPSLTPSTSAFGQSLSAFSQESFSQQSFSHPPPSTPGSFFRPSNSSFTSTNSDFFQTPGAVQNPFFPQSHQMMQGQDEMMDHQPMDGIGEQSQFGMQVEGGMQPEQMGAQPMEANPFQAPQQDAVYQPAPNEQPFMANAEVSFSFGRQSTPPPTRGGRRYQRRKSKIN